MPIEFKPIVLIVPVLVTNWMATTIEKPLGDGRTETVRYKIGITVSNRYATFVVDDRTNRVLVSSQILTNALQVRPDLNVFGTNIWGGINGINFHIPGGWVVTNVLLN